jgi:hypothetical protein
LKDWKVMEVYKYSHCKRGIFKIVYLLDVFPVKIVSEDTRLLECYATLTGKCNNQPDYGTLHSFETFITY